MAQRGESSNAGSNGRARDFPRAAKRVTVKEEPIDDCSVVALSIGTTAEFPLSRGDTGLLNGEIGTDTGDDACKETSFRMDKVAGAKVPVQRCADTTYGKRVHVGPIEDSVEGISGDLLNASVEPIKRVDEVRLIEVGYGDVGGLRKQVLEIRKLVQRSRLHSQLVSAIGVNPPKGILLFGPRGSGKALTARAVAKETGASLFLVSRRESMSDLRTAFEEAEKNAPAIIFIDGIDAIDPKIETTHGEVERRSVPQLLTLMNVLKLSADVIVMGATDRPANVDDALLGYGLFEREIAFGLPDEVGRLEVLRVHTKNMKLSADVDLKEIAANTHGFVGADLAALCREAAMQCFDEKMGLIELKGAGINAKVPCALTVSSEHFTAACGTIKRFAPRETKYAQVEMLMMQLQLSNGEVIRLNKQLQERERVHEEELGEARKRYEDLQLELEDAAQNYKEMNSGYQSVGHKIKVIHGDLVSENALM